MKLLITLTLKNNTTVTRQFDGRPFFETTFVDLSDRLGLTSMSTDCQKNTLEGLRLRKNRTLIPEQKQQLMDSPDLTGDERLLLDIARDDMTTVVGTDVVYDVVDVVKGLSVGNVDDVNDFFETFDDWDDVVELEFKKIEV